MPATTLTGNNCLPNLIDPFFNYYLTEAIFPEGGSRESKVPILTGSGRIAPQFLAKTYEAATKAIMEALPGIEPGDYCIVSADPVALNNGTYIYSTSSGSGQWLPFGGAGTVCSASITYGGTDTDILNHQEGKINFLISSATKNGARLVFDPATKTLSVDQSTGNAVSPGTIKLADVLTDDLAAAGVAPSPKSVKNAIAAGTADMATRITLNGVVLAASDHNINVAIQQGQGVNVTTAADGKITVALNALEAQTAMGLGTAALKSTGTAAGQIPVLDASGKLPDSVIGSLFSTEVCPCNDATVTTRALLVAWVKSQSVQPVQMGDMIVVTNGVEGVAGAYVMGANPDTLTEDTLYSLGTPMDAAQMLVINGLAYTVRNGIITVSASLITEISATGAGASALVVNKNTNTATGECSVTLEVKTATSSQYGVTRISDNYGTAASDIAATLKAVSDALTESKNHTDGKLGSTAITTWGATITAAIAAIGGAQVTTIAKSADSCAGFTISKTGNTVTITLKNASATVPGLVQMATGATSNIVYSTAQTDNAISAAIANKADKGTYITNKIEFTSASVNANGEYVISRVVPVSMVVLSTGDRVITPVTYTSTTTTIKLFNGIGERATAYGGLFSTANAGLVHKIYLGELTFS